MKIFSNVMNSTYLKKYGGFKNEEVDLISNLDQSKANKLSNYAKSRI